MSKKPSNKLSVSEQDLGELQGVYHIKYNFSYFFPHLGLLLACLIGLVLIFNPESNIIKRIAGILFGLIFSAPFLFSIWLIIREIGSELKIYKNGFSYKNQKGLKSCRWEDIKDSFGAVDGKVSRLTSVTKSNGEKIGFAYRMQGLDILEKEHVSYFVTQENLGLPDDSPEETPPEKVGLGERQEVYHVKFSFTYFFPILVILFLAVFGIGVFLISRELLSLFVCALPPTVLFSILVLNLYQDRRDELTIYQNGFTYKTRKGLQSCLWDEIADYSTAGKGVLTGIQKTNDEWISFANEIQGLEKIRPWVRTLIK